MENSRETDCNRLTILIHPGLIQVHQATETRNSKPVCLFPLTLMSPQLFSCILSQTTGNSPGRLLLQIRAPLSVSFSQWTTSVLAVTLKSRGYQGGWKPSLLPCVFCGQQKNIHPGACFTGLLLCSLLHGCNKASSTASQWNKMSIQKAFLIFLTFLKKQSYKVIGLRMCNK